MAFNPPIAFMITWTTYGTRLQGDERGTIDDDTNQRGARKVPPSPRYENLRRSQMSEPEFRLDAKCRGAVDRALSQHADFRGWRLYAKNVRTNHVHIVVGAHAAPEELLRQFKAYATRALRAAGLITGRNRVWTEGGSKKWLFTATHVNEACEYVTLRQGEDLPME
jgi:hypothetical protein